MYNIWGITDKGKVRKENQDSYAFEICDNPSFEVCVICDGMGGAKAGNIASSMAVERFIEEIKDNYVEGMSAEDIAKIGAAAVSEANDEVYEKSVKDEHCSGMGTTLVAVVTRGDDAVIFNVGDSRAYHIGENGIKAITKDHSIVQDLIERGDITAEEAKTHPNRNLITRAIGTEETVECDSYVEKIENEDCMLLCSDGLINTVSDQEILYEIVHGGSIVTCLNRLMKISKSRGAPDNVTIILMQKKGA